MTTPNNNRDQQSPMGYSALRIALIYLVVGTLWILVSDTIAAALFPDPRELGIAQTYKGWFYVILTAWMLYALIRRDVAAVRALDRQRRDAESRFHLRYEAIAAGVLVQDSDGLVTYANRAASQILGLPPERLVGQACFTEDWHAVREDESVLPCEEFPAILAARTGMPVKAVLMGFSAGGSSEARKWLLVNAEPILAGDGRVSEAVATFIDVTDLRQVQRELAQSREAEQRTRTEADRAKREFYRGTIFSVTDGKLSLVSHAEIAELLPTGTVEMPLHNRDDLSRLREAAAAACQEFGVSPDREFEFVSAVGEAAANAVKHAGGGAAAVGRASDRIRVCIRDHGPGMDALILPRATLMRRFSTATSMGLGYSMILQSSDSVFLATGPGGTSVCMELCVQEPLREMSLDALPDIW